MAVLGMAMVVTVIGLSALTAARVEHRAAREGEAAVKADFHAQSAIEVVLFRLSTDPNWRTSYSNDTWTSEETDGDHVFCFKLVDEEDGDLANDYTQPVRLHAKAGVGEAVRIYSVQLCRTDASAANLLSNPGMENGTTDWYGFYCNIGSYTDDQHGGAASIAVTNRPDWYAGPAQTITDKIENGVTYNFEAWARMSSGTAVLRFVMKVRDSESPTQWLIDGATTAGAAEWAELTATMTPTWSGTLQEAFLLVCTESGTADFYIDDVQMAVASGGSSLMAPVSGTWRREVLAP